MRQADDFLEESKTILALLASRDDSCFDTVTQFKGWTINDVIQHLHYFNILAAYSILDETELARSLEEIRLRRAEGQSLRDIADHDLDGLHGQALLRSWQVTYSELAALYKSLDPKTRLKWAGPDMSALSSLSARLMETWAHGLEIFDVLGQERQETDRIYSIVVMGNNTFGWTFKNRGETVPPERPRLDLRAPSGQIWSFNEENEAQKIAGDAVEFCYVVTQARNVADTGLTITGDIAARWMSLAQCFAGPPVAPPPPGTRFRAG